MSEPEKKEHTFMSSLSFSGSEEEITVFCLPCDRVGPRLAAHGYCLDCNEHLCDSCFVHHKKHTLSRNHVLLDKNSMPQTQHFSPANVHRSKPDDFTQPCHKHKKEMIKFYCHDHTLLLCSVCVTLEHMVTSCKVDYISDISSQIVDSEEYTDFLKAVDAISDQCQKMSEFMTKLTARSNSSLTDALSDIRKFRKEINERLDELERKAEDTVNTIRQRNDMRMKKTKVTCDDVAKSLKTSAGSIKQLNTLKQSDKLFMKLKLAEQMMQTEKNTIQQLPVCDLKEYSFESSERVSYQLQKEKSLGTLSQKTLTQKPDHHPTTVLLKSRQTSYLGEISVNSSQDEKICWITGMVQLNPMRLVVTDHDNSSVKMVDTQRKVILDQIRLDVNPWDATSVTSNKVAVTLPNSRQIQFISAYADKLKKRSILKVDGQCQGISCYQGNIVVTFSDPAKIQILDINGTILTTVLVQTLFSYPEYVTTTKSGIYISDWEQKTVTRLNWQGDVMGGYGDLGEPSGIASTDDGNVFVGDNNRYVIQEISGDCSAKKVVLRDPTCARAVCWCSEQSILYFSSESKSNFLQIYKLS